MKLITILGSTGSIGTTTLDVIKNFSNKFKIVGLTAHTNVKKLAIQIKKLHPKIVAVKNEHYAKILKKFILNVVPKPKIVFGSSSYSEVILYSNADMILNAIIGAAGLLPTMAAIDAGVDIALANKESLVIAGNIIMKRVVEKKINLIPIDSEHNAIFQCLAGNNKLDIEEIILTASGGPFLKIPESLLKGVSVRDVLRHPNWSMGNKISVDSATLMNKALEIIEARWLFNIPVNHIKLLIHPQSMIHSMILFKDGTVMAQIGAPDMKAAISYAMSFPNRLTINSNRLDFLKFNTFHFKSVNIKKFPCLALAFEALKAGGVMPAIMNASNEVAVNSFLKLEIPFTKIYFIIRSTMDTYYGINDNSIDNIIEADTWARRKAKFFIINKI